MTSAISLLEVVVAAVIDSWQWPRIGAAVTFGILIMLAGIPSAYNLNFLTFADKLVGTFLLMVGGLCTAILVGYRALPRTQQELSIGMENARLRTVWSTMVRFVVPPVLIVVLFFGVKPLWAAFRVLIGG